MSDGEFLGYAGSLAAGGLLFLILAVLGLGQGVILRVIDVVLGLAFLGYAGYLMVVDPESPFTSWFVLATPVLGLVVAMVARRRARNKIKRLAETPTPLPYAGQDATGHAERQAFPSPPPPLGPEKPTEPRTPSLQAEPVRQMPSGLPDGPPPAVLGKDTNSVRPPRPSGLPSPPSSESPAPSSSPPPSRPHAEPGYRARHGATQDETAEHDYSGGRHRADGES